MNTEFFTALELLEKEEGIPQEYMLEKIEAALVSAFKKEYGNNTNVRVHIDPAKKDVRVYQQKEVVEVVEDPMVQISLEEAKSISKRNVLGGDIRIPEVNCNSFGDKRYVYVHSNTSLKVSIFTLDNLLVIRCKVVAVFVVGRWYHIGRLYRRYRVKNGNFHK